MADPGNSHGDARALERPPWTRAALAYAIGLSLLQLAAIGFSRPLFRALLVADAALGWVIVLACWQGLRAVPYPPPPRFIAVAMLATGHWLAAVVGAWLAIAGKNLA